jgi:protein-S-isoprenylcysteine O-methyltransferase Ste14
MAGLAGLTLWASIAWPAGMDGPLAALTAVLSAALPMVGWSLLVDRVHRNPSTGIDWQAPPRPWRETRAISVAKLVGLYVTWGALACFYCIGRWYWEGGYPFAMHVLAAAALPMLVAAVPYLLWLDRRLAEPRDGAWALGAWLLGGPADWPAIAAHARAWAVKGFFLAFMLSIVPGNWTETLAATAADWRTDPVALAQLLIGIMFTVDVVFATAGYILTLRPLDSHIRSANPFLGGWLAALMCYPPFVLMADGGPLDYHQGTADWSDWLAGHPLLLTLAAFALVALTAVYAWATVAFGLRFSNLTNRGILTHGPYRWTKHPAYLSKNLFWWLATMPFLATTGLATDVIRNTAMLATTSAIYWWRARTEERHLMADPDYRLYAAWMDRNAPLARAARWLRARRSPGVAAAR